MFIHGKIGKKLLVVLISVFVFIEFFGLALLPNPVYSVAGAGDTVIVVNTPINAVNTQNKPLELKQTLAAQLWGSVLGAALHGFSYYMRKLAYDAAMYAASGDKGQGALVYKDGFAAYMEKVAYDSAADAIGELGKPFGLNLCEPPDVNFQIFLQIGLRGIYYGTEGPQPNCTWQELTGSWENIEEQYFGENGQLTTERMFSNALRFENTDFGIAVGATERVDRIQSSQVAGAQAGRLEGEGFKAATDLVSGFVKTPAQVIKEETYAVTNKHQSELTATQLAGIYGSGAQQAVILAGSVFLSTLATEGIKRLQEKFLSLFDESGGGEDASSAMSFESAGFQMSLKKAKEVFSSFLAVKIEQRENYDLLTEFTTCPDTAPTIPGLNNCVMDDGLREAVRRADTGEPMTIREAMKEGLLKGDWILASPRRLADNTSFNCYKNAYCYSNIQKLRRSRILPLGFEIAALLADPDHPQEKWTLQYVVDHFDDCRDDNKDGVIEPDATNYPYCHLIDPNWIIKAPDSRCNGFVYSSNLTDHNSGLRAQECVDAPTRIQEGSNSRSDLFGYCTREKKVWRLPGEACESYYNTCTIYSAKGGALASYLAKTVDYGDCNIDSVGCLAYSAEKDGDKWVASVNAKDISYKQYGRNQALYFNEKIKNYSCSASDNGCSAFYLGVLKDGTTDEYINDYLRPIPIFIKKAPDYLGCYDIDKTTPQTEWPQTKPELAKVSQDEKCADFAQVCLPEEVGCDSYTPKKGSYSVPIPGIAGEENKCNESCVGYDTFKQNETEFAPSEFPLYFIPQNGKTCPGQYAGCDEFTNIDELAKGGEGLEYYTDIKYCELPNEQNQKVFYSWYGSMSEGYVLKLHKLRPVNDKDSAYLENLGLNLGNETVGEFFPVGSPAYASDNPDKLEEFYTNCNAIGYNLLINGGSPGIDGAAVPDCRALYDKNGKVYYRLLENTITVSDECHPLRKTTAYFYDDAALKTQATCEERGGYWNSTVCQRCTNGGIYKDGSCVYWAIAKPGESNSCNGPSNNKDAYNGCREYVGNAGGNEEVVDPFPLDFEPVNNDLNAAKAGWSPADKTQVVAESVQVGLHSLKVTADYLNYLIASSALEKDGWYELSFWARGKTQSLGAYFVQIGANNIAQSAGSFTSAGYKLSIGDDWKEYKLGPIQFTGDPLKDTILIFESKTQSPPILYFLDNMELRLVPDTYAIIKDSWKTKFPYNGQSVTADVPLVCDANPTDPFPGDALGCRAYSEESTGNTVNVTGFEKLCRVEAVGCRAVFDSYNTKETGMTAYNVWCKGSLGDDSCQLMIDDDKLGECKIEQGKIGCYVDKIVVPDIASLPASAQVRDSTIIIPADTPVDAPVYLTVRPEFSCLEKAKGCQEIGLEEQILPDKSSDASYQHIETYLLNDPGEYTGANGTLCRDDLVGCEAFKAGSDIFYFKNPIKTGNSFCEYKAKVEKDGVEYKGWFLKDVGVCYDAGGSTSQICGSDSDCGETETCQDKGKVPCYEDYLKAGGFYDIWSNENIQYDGKVGVCPSEKNGCRELIDPADISQIHPEGQPYYAIFDNRVTGKAGECEGQVSQVEGCVLFNKTDEPNLLYDSVETYKNSENKQFALVSPVTNTNSKDSNWLLKVIRDRQCAEWLACKGSLPIPDTQSPTGERYSCYALQPCADGNNWECAAESTLNSEISNRLTYDQYIGRDVSWSGSREFSGYSLFEKAPAANLEFITVKKTNDNGLKQDAIFVGYINKKAASACSASATDNGKKCGSKGICYEKKCINSPDDSYPAEFFVASAQSFAANNFYKYLYKVECRGYPEQDSPFGGSPADIPELTKSMFSNVKFCAEGEDCACNYVKVEYGSGNSAEVTKYYQLGGVLHPDLQKGGICQGGTNDGKSCSSDKDCADKQNEANNGICIRQIKRNTRIGWNGYCLERDLSRHINGRTDDAPDAFACLTWLPLDYVPGLFDIYYSDPSTGYVPPTGKGQPGQAYCTEMLGVGGLSPELKFDCKIGDEFPDNSLLKNICPEDVPKNNFWIPSVFSVDYGDGMFFSEVQERTRSFIKALSGNGNGFTYDSFDSQKTYHYISRVDVALVPSDSSDVEDTVWDTPGGEWDDNYGDYGKGGYPNFKKYDTPEALLLGSMLTNNSVFYAMAMSQGGYTAEHKSVIVPYAPLFPDVESFGETDGDGSWLQALKNEGVVGYNLDYAKDNTSVYDLIMESEPIENLDSGVLRQRENRMETFLTKDMIYAVSFVPMWLSEGGGDDVNQYFPAMGMPMTIYLDKEYPVVGGQSIDIDMKKSSVGSKCAFCKYWIMSTDHPAEAFNSKKSAEGYLLQWFAGDPVSQDSWFDNSIQMAYSNANSYLVNPLEADNVKCDKKEDDGNLFIAVEILFDKDSGEFIGYRSRNCIKHEDAETGYAMAVIFTLRPMCVEAVKVYDESGNNKAYTDRVWSGGEEVTPNTYQSNFVDKDTDASYYGSARFSSLDNCETDNPWCYLYRNPSSDALHGGTPWQCLDRFKSGVGTSFSGSCPLEEIWQSKPLGYNRTNEAVGYNICNGQECAGSQKYLLFDSLFATFYGRFRRVGSDVYELNSDKAADLTAQGNKLHKFINDKTYDYIYYDFSQSPGSIVVNSYPILQSAWSSSTAGTSLLNNGKPIILFGDHASFRGVPPRIYPVIDCVGQKCELDKTNEGFSVNGASGSKVDDRLFGTAVKMAQVQFFAWADHNQMPLRRIMVDWREKGVDKPDNTISGTSQGYYTNYKPYCGDDSGKAKECVKKSDNYIASGSGITCQNDKECPTTHPTCTDVGPKFGNQPGKTCKENPVVRIFNYTCDADSVSAVKVGNFKTVTNGSVNLAGIVIDPSLGQKWYNFLKDKGFTNDDAKVCVFQPRVQVLDNWGWCTGECVKEYGGATPKATATKYDGCYNDLNYDLTDSGAISHQCDPDSKYDGLDQWKYFNNIIVVAPGTQ